ncbi:MAG: hypothetical protein KJO54_13020 [Gammaproteobacteria bacterium]|nr:hypothetical protein [Gammaproteobacteria bacterium]NNF61905.1 hypothetical protein [Gammaproteobacteria bacterium]NNM19791.1 hypothetical protein [Gammaproteobacteria bacterium]
MSEDHIKTVVIDQPLDHRADDHAHEEPMPENSDAQQQDNYAPGPPPPSWLS